jgi:pilus assembly protein CpaB
MSSRNIILLVVALLIAAFTIFALRSRVQPAPEAQSANVVRILVAKKDISPGAFIRTMEHLDWKAVEKDAPTDGKIVEGTESIANFEGAVARQVVRAGEPIPSGSLITPGAGGFLSAVLEAGMRAVSIAVNATSGNAGFLFPGDRVDLVLSHKLPIKNPSTGDTSEVNFSNTFIENIRVVAVDQLLDNPENKAILAKTVTVEVTPKQVEEIQVATEMGKVSFALRSLTDKTTSLTEGATSSEDVISAMQKHGGNTAFTSDAEVSPALSQGAANSNVRVLRGEKTEEQTFYNR